MCGASAFHGGGSRVRGVVLCLVVLELGLLLAWEHFRVVWRNAALELRLEVWVEHVPVWHGQVILVLERRHLSLLPQSKSQAVVMHNVDHVVGIDGAKRCHTDPDDAEEGSEDLIANLDEVCLSTANTNPSDEEEHPGSTPEGDQKCVERYQEPNGYGNQVNVNR